MSVLQKLTEGIVHRDVAREGHALLSKWEKTGLLEGMGDDRAKNTMAVLLENQAKELLREASAMAAGDVEGFAAVAFPIVRRVFGGLIANDLVSVQPMSLPSGLIFFLDFSHSTSRAGMEVDKSIYGGDILGKELATSGVDLNPADREGPRGFYDLGTGFSSPTGSAIVPIANVKLAAKAVGDLTAADKKLLRFDPDILAAAATDKVQIVDFVASGLDQLDTSALTALTSSANFADNGGDVDAATNAVLVRRLTAVSPDDTANIRLVFHGGATTVTMVVDDDDLDLEYPMTDDFTATGRALGAIVGQDQWGLEEAGKTSGDSGASHAAGKDAIPEIDIKVDSIAVTAVTKKLKAKWTPELGQDLNAYHNLDAEVELTGILSEHIALEIDQEILGDLINGAKAGTRYWSRAPGLFVDSSGAELGATAASPDFTGTVSEWYETLIETINDVSAQIHRKTLRGGANFVVCSPEVANILEFTSGFRASVTADQDKGTIGAVKSGSLSKKFDVFVDPYFPRNVILVGRKGGSFLESGYVYAPYVPLQVTPTIFGTEDFVPRKGVMTRYAKKMVRPDMYGLVVVRGLLGESGAS